MDSELATRLNNLTDVEKSSRREEAEPVVVFFLGEGRNSKTEDDDDKDRRKIEFFSQKENTGEEGRRPRMRRHYPTR